MRITDTYSFGNAIRQRRRQLGYTQAYLSEVTGLSTSFLSNLENGKETAELGKAIFVASILALNLELNERGK